jgi:hypothetical protein
VGKKKINSKSLADAKCQGRRQLQRLRREAQSISEGIILNLNLKKCDIFYCALNNFRRLKNAVRRKRPENGQPIFDFTLKTMLQHSGRFWSMIFCRRTMRQQ